MDNATNNEGLPAYSPEQVRERELLQRRLSASKYQERDRRSNALSSRKTRKTAKNKEYNTIYQQAYLLNPVNRLSHQIRVNLRNWLTNSKEINKKQVFKDVDKESYINKLNKKALRNGFLAWDDSNTSLDHIISIRYFLEFGITDRVIICDIRNINVVSTERNSSKRNAIPDAAVKIAYELEKEFNLVGFTDYVIEQKFNLEVVAKEKVEARARELQSKLDAMPKLGIKYRPKTYNVSKEQNDNKESI
jgi:hypothetical protein